MVIRTIAHPHNLKLVRGIPAGATNPGIDESVSDRALAIPNPGVTKAAREHAAGLTPNHPPLNSTQISRMDTSSMSYLFLR